MAVPYFLLGLALLIGGLLLLRWYVSAEPKQVLRAARWVVGRAPGLYGMRDVLGLETVN